MRLTFGAILLLSVSAILFAADTPVAKPKPAATQPAATQPAEFVVGEMQIQTIRPIRYFFVSQQITFDQMGAAIEKQLPRVAAFLKEKKIQQDGPVMFGYKGMEDMTKPFQYEIGVIVTEEAKPLEDFKVERRGDFKCATILFTGPVSSIGAAYGKLMGQVAAAGHQMTGESREMYLYWEEVQSRNNVVQIQVGIK